MSHPPPLPALEHLSDIRQDIGARTPAFFLDFDGTLAPIVDHPEAAEMPAETREAVAELARTHPVCVISGRTLAFLRERVALDHVYYAAAHGHRIVGPKNSKVDFSATQTSDSALEAASRYLETVLGEVEGAVLEVKEVSLAVHYRLVARKDRSYVRDVVEKTVASYPGFRLMEGKLVYELMPSDPWGKGKAVLWLLEHLRATGSDICPICLGDDVTDEDMFVAVGMGGVTVIVGDPGTHTQAHYRVRDPEEAVAFLRQLAAPSNQATTHLV